MFRNRRQHLDSFIQYEITAGLWSARGRQCHGCHRVIRTEPIRASRGCCAGLHHSHSPNQPQCVLKNRTPNVDGSRLLANHPRRYSKGYFGRSHHRGSAHGRRPSLRRHSPPPASHLVSALLAQPMRVCRPRRILALRKPPCSDFGGFHTLQEPYGLCSAIVHIRTQTAISMFLHEAGHGKNGTSVERHVPGRVLVSPVMLNR